jgi:glutaredoxin
MAINHDDDILLTLNWKSEISEKNATQKSTIYYFSLTTCVYCKKGIQWLKDRQISFNWLYLDDYPQVKKNKIKEWIQERYHLKSRMASPFVIFRQGDTDFISNGYDPDYWKVKAR